MIVAHEPAGEEGLGPDDAGRRRRARAPAWPRSAPRGTPASRRATFATVTCPAWMMGYIQGQAPNSAGDWDIAVRSGRRRQLGRLVPRRSRSSRRTRSSHAELVKFLTSPASEAYVFKQTGNLPSEPGLYSTRRSRTSRTRSSRTHRSGRSSPARSMALKPQITGPHQGDIQTAAIERDPAGRAEEAVTPRQSWAQFLKDVANVAT